MPWEVHQQLFLPDVPHLQGGVGASATQQTAVGGPGHLVHPVYMTSECRQKPRYKVIHTQLKTKLSVHTVTMINHTNYITDSLDQIRVNHLTQMCFCFIQGPKNRVNFFSACFYTLLIISPYQLKLKITNFESDPFSVNLSHILSTVKICNGQKLRF